MVDFLGAYYLWLKAFHIIAVIAWMAGMLYLPRLFVYHAQSETSSQISETFKVMERRLLRFIMNPALIITWILGLSMIWVNPDLFSQGWMHVKFTAVVGLTALHGIFAMWRKKFEKDQNIHSPKFYKIWNEVPTALMILIVIVAVVKPF